MRKGPCATSSILLEWHLAVVLPQEVQELLVVTLLHVEKPRDDLVIATRLLKSLAHEIPHISARDFPLHIQGIHGRPERFAFLEKTPVEIIGNRAPTFTFGL